MFCPNIQQHVTEPLVRCVQSLKNYKKPFSLLATVYLFHWGSSFAFQHILPHRFSCSLQLSSNNGSQFHRYHLPHFPVKHVSSGFCLTTQEWYGPTAGHRGRKEVSWEKYTNRKDKAILYVENACWRWMVIRFLHSVGLTDGLKSKNISAYGFYWKKTKKQHLQLESYSHFIPLLSNTSLTGGAA